MDEGDLADAYTDLEKRVKAVPIESTKCTLQSYSELIDESNDLIKKAKATEEIIKDAEVVSKLISSIHESTKCINVSETNFDPEIFAGYINNIISCSNEETDENWAALTSKCAVIYKYAPGLTYLSTSSDDQLSQVVKERKERQARKPLEKRKEPEKVQTVTKTDQGVTVLDKIVRLLRRCYELEGRKPICFFRFTVDPNSFSKTVENIFNLSFLAKDRHVEISLDNQRLPVLTPRAEGNTNNKDTSQTENIQLLVSITQPQWRDIIREFNITKAIMP